MKHVVDGDRVFVRLMKGEEVFSSLESLANKYGWKSAHLSGIGALMNVELGCYELDKKEYIRKTFKDIHELLSLEGNLCRIDSKPVFHIHTIISDHNFECRGGHLFSAVSAITVEINIRVFDAEVTRKLDEKVGLSLLEFCPV